MTWHPDFETRLRVALLRLALAVGLAAFSINVVAQAGGAADESALTVGIADCPPFVIMEGEQATGLAIFLWERVANELGLAWNYRHYPLGSLLELLAQADPDKLPDVGISCTSVTAEREAVIDFSHSFFETHTAIAVQETSVWAAVKAFFANPLVVNVLLVVLGIAALIGGVFFLLEHRINKKLFSSPTLAGRIIEPFIVGLMFVTNGPIRFYRFKTLTGRVLATMLTLSSTLFIAAITAVFASSFTLHVLQSEIRTLEDLRDARVGALEASTSSIFLKEQNIPHETLPELELLLLALEAGELDAIVSDAAFLQFGIRLGQQQGRFQSLAVLPQELDAQNYAFILHQGSPMREGVNRALLNERVQRDWRDRLRQYLGE
jgi:polar amino acid transport system substrate-binding protein